jgi:hypothetical protein
MYVLEHLKELDAAALVGGMVVQGSATSVSVAWRGGLCLHGGCIYFFEPIYIPI